MESLIKTINGKTAIVFIWQLFFEKIELNKLRENIYKQQIRINEENFAKKQKELEEDIKQVKRVGK